MSKSNATENETLAALYHGTPLSFDAATDHDLHLHTGDPGEAGTSLTSEATYTGYAVVTVARDATGWDLTGSVISNDDLLQFPICSGGTNVITHLSVTPSGSTQIIHSGALNASRSISDGIKPIIDIGALTVTED